ncbi:MAG: phage holin family protein [Caldilineaceae bacterium]|nr:phage holin family protein [Caldilineaceae bacterium]MCB9139659.1 phage holin family protein [Caldilineaceae bacterium]
MRSLLLRWLLLSLAVAFTDWLLPGFIIYQGAAGVAIVAALLGIVNAVIRPIVKLLTCPLIFFTLGLFSLVINALMLIIVQQLRPDLIYLENFTTTLIASIIISIASAVLNMTLYDGRRYRR